MNDVLPAQNGSSHKVDQKSKEFGEADRASEDLGETTRKSMALSQVSKNKRIETNIFILPKK